MVLQVIAALLGFGFSLGPVQPGGVLNFGAQSVFFTLCLPFMIDINILIAYYWQRALTGKLLAKKCMRVMLLWLQLSLWVCL